MRHLNNGTDHRHSKSCCDQSSPARRTINISPVDQTKLFQLRTAFLWETAYGCMTTRRLIIQWSQKILTIDIIISWKLLWDQRPQTIWILHDWNTKTTRFQSKRVLVLELLTYSHEDRLPNRLIQITRIGQTLPISIQFGPFYQHGLMLIPPWISNHIPSLSWNYLSHSQTSTMQLLKFENG